MNYCHTCVYYNNASGWCSIHNEMHSSSGSCSKWRSGNASRREKPKFTPFSKAGAVNDENRKKGSRSKKYRGLGCGTCTWWDSDARKCTNKRSEAYNTRMSSGALCTIYQQYPGAPLMSEERLKKIIESGHPRIDHSNLSGGKTGNSKKHNKKSKRQQSSSDLKAPLQKKSNNTKVGNPAPAGNVNHNKIINQSLANRKRKGKEYCNRCHYYDHGMCNNKKSKLYLQKKKTLDWCVFFELCRWL